MTAEPAAKVFVSYSRRDLAFVDALDAALRERGVEPLIDRAEIYAFEDWWARIEDLIVSADTIVFVLSPDSVTSPICAREVAHAAALNKRLAPVVARTVDPSDAPAELRRLNFVRLDDPGSYSAGIDRLVEALLTDIGWVRRHSEFVELARRWSEAGRPGPQGMLLRPPALEDAESWIASRPANAPPPTDETRELILTSRRATTRRRQAISAVLAVGLALALVLSGLALWQRGVAVRNEAQAVAARAAEAEQRRLAETRERQAIEAGNRTLVGQSRFLADLAERSLADGDAGTALLYGLEGLPDPDVEGGGRPLVPEAERSLDRARAALGERGLASRVVGTRLAVAPDGHFALSFGGGEQVLADLVSGEITRTELPAEIVDAAWSPDGRRYARCSGSAIEVAAPGSASVLSIDPAREEAIPKGTLRACRFGPDGATVLAVGADGRAGLWSAGSGELLRRFGWPGARVGPVPSPDGTRLAVVEADGAIQVIDASSGRNLATLPGPGEVPGALELSSGGDRILATGYPSGKARVWSVADGSSLAEFEVGERASAHLTPDGAAVVVEGRTGPGAVGSGFVIRDAATGAERAKVGPTLRQTTLAFGSDGKRLVAGSLDGSLHVYDLGTGREVATFAGGRVRILSAALLPDGQHVLSSAFDSRLVLWTADPQRSSRTLATVPGPVLATVPADQRTQLIVGSANGSLRAWVPDEAGAGTALAEAGSGVLAIASAPGGARLLAFGRDGAASLLDAARGTVLARYPGAVVPAALDRTGIDAAFSPDGERFVVRTPTGGVSLRLAADGREVWLSPVALDHLAAAFLTPDGRRIVAWSPGGEAVLLDARTGERLAALRNTPVGLDGRPLPGGDAADPLPWSVLRASPDGRRLVTDGPLQPRLWSLETGEPEGLLLEHEISSDRVDFLFGPEPERLFSLEAGRTVTEWDLGTGIRIRSFRGHGQPITALRLSPDGRRLLTASRDGSARLWDRASGVELAAIRPKPAGPLLDARFWPDGSVVTASADGRVTAWPLPRDARAAVIEARSAISRCLTASQRRRAFLDPAPPDWCVTGPGREQEADPALWRPKPPYGTPIWARWYRAKQAGTPLELPDGQ